MRINRMLKRELRAQNRAGVGPLNPVNFEMAKYRPGAGEAADRAKLGLSPRTVKQSLWLKKSRQ